MFTGGTGLTRALHVTRVFNCLTTPSWSQNAGGKTGAMLLAENNETPALRESLEIGKECLETA